MQSPTPAPPSLPLPAVFELSAPESWRSVDFLSDLHLGPDTPKTFDAWVTHLRNTPADAVFILGDLVEAWVGDDSRFDGFDAVFAQALGEAASRRPTYFMVGNRDFLMGHEMLDACGVMPLPDPTAMSAFGHRILLTHGDELCLEDIEYQQIRKQVRHPLWQQQALAQPLQARREAARALREQSRQRALTHGSMEWADLDIPTTLDWMRQTRTSTLVHGHTHRPATETLALGQVRHVLSDWDLDHPTMPRAEILRWSHSGFERLQPVLSA